MNGSPNITPTDVNALAFSRTTTQVLNIVCAGGASGNYGFFPLAGEGHDHLRFACTAGPLGPSAEPLGQRAVLLKQQKPPSELDHTAAYAGIARLGEAFLAPFRSAFVRRASKPRVACDGPAVAQVTRNTSSTSR